MQPCDLWRQQNVLSSQACGAVLDRTYHRCWSMCVRGHTLCVYMHLSLCARAGVHGHPLRRLLICGVPPFMYAYVCVVVSEGTALSEH